MKSRIIGLEIRCHACVPKSLFSGDLVDWELGPSLRQWSRAGCLLPIRVCGLLPDDVHLLGDLNIRRRQGRS